jgi:L-glutamine-phosphate cytidylyltransferase
LPPQADLLGKQMKAIILAAGAGKRLGGSIPKPLTSLVNGKTIMDFQVERLSKIVGVKNITVVVGYKKEMIIEKFPQLSFVYNDAFAQTNTSKSLLLALRNIGDDAMWLNGDVYFDADTLGLLLNTGFSCCLVDRKRCGREEVKYDLNEDGFIHHISKNIRKPQGECLGVNVILKKDLDIFRDELEKVGNQDYFEKAMENLTVPKKINLKPVDAGSFYCNEIDFKKDLTAVKNYLITRDGIAKQ